MTTSLRLKKKTFLIMIKEFNHIDGKGRACYKPALRYVCGDVFTYLDHKWGIYRKEHTADRKRKSDYVLVDSIHWANSKSRQPTYQHTRRP